LVAVHVATKTPRHKGQTCPPSLSLGRCGGVWVCALIWKGRTHCKKNSSSKRIL